jgi:hypothetical protein
MVVCMLVQAHQSTDLQLRPRRLCLLSGKLLIEQPIVYLVSCSIFYRQVANSQAASPWSLAATMAARPTQRAGVGMPLLVLE